MIEKKTFVLDTNVLLHGAESLFAFEDNHVVLPIQVIEELDRFKKDPGERGRNARRVARDLDILRQKGPLCSGVTTDSGGTVTVLIEYEPDLPAGMDRAVIDNQIIGAANLLMRKQSGQDSPDPSQVIFVSKDINARIKADALGILSEDYETNKINFEELYQGWSELNLSESERQTLDEEGSFQPGQTYLANQFFCMDSAAGEVLGIYDADTGRIRKLEHGQRSPWGIKALNPQQSFALECLLDEKIRLVSLVGQAGTGKTLLGLAAGLQRTLDDLSYERLLVSRPIMPLGKDIGYLPGSKDEKLTHWMQPIFDNLNYIFDNFICEGLPSEQLDLLLTKEKICLEAITYIRGRSITNQWLMIDEAQNLTPHEIKTIISRAGEGTKVIITGDPYQIDNPYLDPSSNGLTYLVERFKGQSIFGNVVLTSSERSHLASLAVELL